MGCMDTKIKIGNREIDLCNMNNDDLKLYKLWLEFEKSGGKNVLIYANGTKNRYESTNILEIARKFD